MQKFHIQKIEPENTHQALEDFLSKKPFIPVSFYGPHGLNTWLSHNGKSLYIATSETESFLLLHREKNNDIRILFNHPTDTLLDSIRAHFNPRYIAVNECPTPPDGLNFTQDTEVEIFLEPIAKLQDPTIRKQYNAALRKHPSIRFEPYIPEYADKIREFIQKWNTTRSPERNKHAHTENDLHFLDQYQNDPQVVGGVVFDNENIIAINLSVPSADGKLFALINKCLRGYTNLGVFLYVERAKYFLTKGISSIYIGNVNNDFKKQFLNNAIVHPVYAYEIYKAPDLQVSDNYLVTFFN